MAGLFWFALVLWTKILILSSLWVPCLTANYHGGHILVQNTNHYSTEDECTAEKVTVAKKPDYLELFNVIRTNSNDCSKVWKGTSTQDIIVLAFPEYTLNCKASNPCPAVIATRNSILPMDEQCYNLVAGNLTYLDAKVQISGLRPLTVFCGKYFHGLLLPTFFEEVMYEQWNRRAIKISLEAIEDANESSLKKFVYHANSSVASLKTAFLESIREHSKPNIYHSPNLTCCLTEQRLEDMMNKWMATRKCSEESEDRDERVRESLPQRREMIEKMPNVCEKDPLETELVFWMLLVITGITALTLIILIACSCWLSWEIKQVQTEN